MAKDRQGKLTPAAGDLLETEPYCRDLSPAVCLLGNQFSPQNRGLL